MTSRRTRDLSGFDLPEPPRKQPPKPRAARPHSSAKKEKKQRTRITLSMPTAVADRLRAHAEATGLFYLDIISAAFDEHGDDVRAAHTTQAVSSLGGRVDRRKVPSGRVQIALGIAPDALELLDSTARAANLDRSWFVAELLDGYLPG